MDLPSLDLPVMRVQPAGRIFEPRSSAGVLFRFDRAGRDADSVGTGRGRRVLAAGGSTTESLQIGEVMGEEIIIHPDFAPIW